jgi:hypothetical protein
MGTGAIGQPFQFPNSDEANTKFGGSIVPETDCTLNKWNVPNKVPTGTGLFRVGIFANVNISGLDQAGAFIAESNEITLDTSDVWRQVTFTGGVALTKGTKYWVLGWSDVIHTAWYSFADGPIQQTYVAQASSGPAYPNWDKPAIAVNGSDVNCNNVFVSGYGEYSFTGSMPTYYATTSIPLDQNSASNATTQITWSQRFHDMKAGDFIWVALQQRGAATHSIGVTGGQTWSSFTIITGTNISVRIFYCTFNGTWGASPRFDFSAGICTSAVIEAYRPSAITSTWGVDISQIASSFLAVAGAKIINGVSPTNPNNVTIALWATADDNTWTSTSGTDWYNGGVSYQSRNLAGTDQSTAVSHKIQAAAGATGNVERSQSSLGPDAGIAAIFSIYEIPLTISNATPNFLLLGVG